MKREARRIRVIIASSDAQARERIRTSLSDEPDMVVVAECETADSTLPIIRAYRPELVFLDANIAGGDAFSVVEQLGPDRMPDTIFMTPAGSEFAATFEAHGLDYITLPCQDTLLGEVIRHARARLAQPASATRAARLSAFLERRDPAADENGAPFRFMVRERDKTRFIPADEVDWIEGARNYVRLHVGDRTHLLRGPLTAIYAQLDQTTFARIHRSIIVNVQRIGEVQPWVGGDYVAVLRSGERLRVSRNFKEGILRAAL